jgi:multidrug efflux system membrane fusion protein
MKAEFPNPDLSLWPGQFVNIRLLVDTLQQVVVVPVAAVQRGPNGAFVYAVDAESKAEVRPVTVTRQDDTSAVIGAGVSAGDRVVTSGFTRLSNGTRVRVQAGEDQAAPPVAAGEKQNPAAAPEERRRKREGGEKGEGKQGRKKQDGSADNSSATSTKQ